MTMPKPFPISHRFRQKTFLVLALGAAALAGCETVPQTGGQPPAPVVQRAPVPAPTPAKDAGVKTPETKPEDTTKEPSAPTNPNPTDGAQTAEGGKYFNNRQGLTPPHMRGRDTKRVALLLPFSTPSERLREEAASMFRAAELSVFERESADVLLIALDTQGTESGAKSATRAAIKAGADVILGPVIAPNVRAASREAARSKTPVIAFSNDQTVAGSGTYLLSFPPEAEVARVVEYAASSGTTRFAFMGPDSAYGRRVKAAYEASVAQMAGQVTASESYSGNDITVMQTPAQRIAAFHAEGERAARANGGLTPMSFEAILLPEGGTPLRSLAPLLPYYEVDPADVQFMGTSRWANEDTVREPALNRGIFAGPDKDAQAAFNASYERTYGDAPSNLASLAYDAVTLGAYIADGDPRTRRFRAETPEGFYGVDGLVRFGADGKPERGLAVYQIRNGRFVVIDPAPRNVQGGT